MFFVPFTQQTLTTTVPLETLQDRIADYLAADMFGGTVSPEGFRLVYVDRRRRDTYKPWILGHFHVVGSALQLRITYTLHPIAIFIMGFFVAIAIRELLTRHSWTGVLFVVAMHCLFYTISFRPQVRKAEDIFLSITGAS